MTIFVLQDFILRLEAEPQRGSVIADRVTPLVLQTHRVELCIWS